MALKGHIPWNKGLKGVQDRSLETRKKISEGMKGKSTAWLKGRKLTQAHKDKLSVSGSGKKRPWVKGQKIGFKHSKESLLKMGAAHRGEKAANWKGGISIGANYKSWKETMGRRRRNHKLNAEGLHTNGEWELLKLQYGLICPCCHKSEPEIKLSKDHIIPLSRGGSDWIENIQPLCLSCNKKKHLKTTKYERI
jgi:hypothetical protein